VDFPFFLEKGSGAGGFLVDNRLTTPYTMSATLSLQRELPRRLTLDVGYVGTFGRQQLSYLDLAQYYGYLLDPASGENLWGAYNRIVDLIGPDPFNPRINPGDPAALATIRPIAFFENMLPGLPAFRGAPQLTPTQAFYAMAARAGGSWTAPLQDLDLFLTPGASPWNRRIDPQQDGFVLFHPQYGSIFNALSTFMNFGSSNYHSLQISLRRQAGAALFAVNYVLSKSIDNGSAPENIDIINDAAGADQIQNAFRTGAGRAVSNFDLRHNFNAHGVFDLPFGRGRAIGKDANGFKNALIGGWAVTGVWRWRSGFPLSVTNGFAYPTSAINQGPATLNAPLKSSVTRSDARGSANLFRDPDEAINRFTYTRPGAVGSRNVIRGPAYFSIDLGLHKRFQAPWSERQRLEFRAVAFNALNQVNLATGFFQGSRSIDASDFGRLTNTAGGGRQFEFALRYEF